MRKKLIENIKQFESAELANVDADFDYQERTITKSDYTLHLGDSAEVLKKIPTDSMDFSVCSIPFGSLYTYSNTERDLGNSKDMPEFLEHFAYIAREWLRVTKPGRNNAIHVSDIPAMQCRDGYIGMKDFSGDIIRAMEREGWIWYGPRITIDKSPHAQAIRTHAKGLSLGALKKDSAGVRTGMPDYILLFQKPGENKVPIKPIDNKEMVKDDWLEPGRSWANPIWYGISESDTLNFRDARGNDDERHICPLQLGVIERCIKLWSNPGETVLSPFMGIGSEGHVSLKLGRKFVGIELKSNYFNTAVKNLAETKRIGSQKQLDMFGEKPVNRILERLRTGA